MIMWRCYQLSSRARNSRTTKPQKIKSQRRPLFNVDYDTSKMIALQAILWIVTLLLPQFTLGGSFTNPLRKKDGSDPFMVYADGYYYLMTTTWKDVQLTRAKTVEGLKRGETKVVWKDGDKNRCCNVWAPGQFSPKHWGY